MKVIQLTPGAGAMYCGNCLRDNALVAAMRLGGHDAVMIPLYLPLTLDESDLSLENPVFFSGINVYLEQILPVFRKMPAWLHQLLSHRFLLKLAAGKAASTRPQQVGKLTVSMLQGENGNQARELKDLIHFLKSDSIKPPDVLCLSNAMLIGMAHQIQSQLHIPVVCMLQGEDDFLDSLPPQEMEIAWDLIKDKARSIPAFVAPTRYFAQKMSSRLNLSDSQLHIIPNGIQPQGFVQTTFSAPRTIGFFARMCRAKGLHTLVDAFTLLKKDPEFADVQLAIGGSCGPNDKILVDSLHIKLKQENLHPSVQFHPNLTKQEKIDFFSRLHIFSVPANYSEAFGLYLLEAMASGVPCVQPNVSGFHELIVPHNAGWCYDSNDATSLSLSLKSALRKPDELIKRGQNGVNAIHNTFHIQKIAQRYLDLFASLIPIPDK
nr:glycosyltransferase [Cytophagales bacterium]